MSTIVAALAGALAAPALIEAVRGLRLSHRRRHWAGGRVLGRLLALAGAAARAHPEGLQERVDAAHLPMGIDAGVLMSVKVSLAAGSGLLVFVAASFWPLDAAPILLLLVPAGSFLVPDIVLARRARRIRAQVLAEVPDFTDRLHLAVSAGVPPLRAATLASAGGEGALSREVAAATSAAQAGVAFASALDRLARRCPCAEVRSVSAALQRSQVQGTDIAPLLLDISRAARSAESLRMRDRAQKAAPKIQLAVALMLVPAAMALIAAALLSGLFFS